MADQLQLRRGTTAQNLLFTGAQGEVIVDTDKNTVVVHNGSTAGGFPLASSRQVSDSTFYYNEDAGSAANAYILTPKANTISPTAYLGGIQFGFVTTKPNTGPSSASFQGLGVKSLKFAGGVDPLAGEINGRTYLIYDEANDWLEIQRKATVAQPQISNITASVNSSTMTVAIQPRTIDFRNTTLNNGLTNSRNVTSAISLVIPNGATLGTTNATLGRIAVLAIYGPTAVEVAVTNISNGSNLDETGLINTTAISAASTSATAIYSTTARAGVPYRIMGFVESTQPTAGIWSTSPSLVQGSGGRALAILDRYSGFAFGATWQNVTASRALATTYTNTTGSCIAVSVTCIPSTAGQFFSATLASGVDTANTGAGQGSTRMSIFFIVAPGGTYNVTLSSGTVTSTTFVELRP